MSCQNVYVWCINLGKQKLSTLCINLDKHNLSAWCINLDKQKISAWCINVDKQKIINSLIAYYKHIISTIIGNVLKYCPLGVSEYARIMKHE